MIEAQVAGSVETGLEPVRETFATNFENYGEVGAAFCVHLNGRQIVDLWGGVTAPGNPDPYTADTLQMVMSTTKGAVAVAAKVVIWEVAPSWRVLQSACSFAITVSRRAASSASRAKPSGVFSVWK